MNDEKFLSCFKTLDVIEEQEAEWFSQGYIPKGSITSLCGDGGVGKSTILINMCASRSNGKPCFFDLSDYQSDPQKVMLCSGEDSIRKKLKRRLREAGANMNNIIVPDFSQENTKQHHAFKFGSDCMAEAIEYFRPDLCIFDPIESFIPPNYNMGARNQMRDCLDPFIALGESTGTTFILVVHSNKRKGAFGRERMADSADIWDISRSVLMFGLTEGQGVRYVSHEKSNYGEEQKTLLFSIDEKGCVIPAGTTWKKDREYQIARAENVNPTTRTECKEFLLAELEASGNEMPVKDLEQSAKANEYSDATIRRAKEDLKNANMIKYHSTGNGNNKVWYIKRAFPSEIKT